MHIVPYICGLAAIALFAYFILRSKPAKQGWFARNRRIIIEKGNGPPPKPGTQY